MKPNSVGLEQLQQEYANSAQYSNQRPPKDYLIVSIFSAVCCNIYFGIAAIVFLVKTRENIRINNLEEANGNSKTAFRLIAIAIAIFYYSISRF